MARNGKGKGKGKRKGRKGVRKGKNPFRSAGKSRNVITNNMVLYDPPSMYQAPIPRIYRTKFVTEYTGYLAGGSAMTGRLFHVKLNCPEVAFADSATGVSGFVNITTAGFTASTGQPAVAATFAPGYRLLANGLIYTAWKVHASKLEIQCNPGQDNDSVKVAIMPNATDLSKFATYPTMVNQPLVRSAVFSSGKDAKGHVKNGWLTSYLPVRTALGLTKIQEEADTIMSSGNTGANEFASIAAVWCVALQSTDNDVAASALGITARVTHYVSLYFNSEGIST